MNTETQPTLNITQNPEIRKTPQEIVDNILFKAEHSGYGYTIVDGTQTVLEMYLNHQIAPEIFQRASLFLAKGADRIASSMSSFQELETAEGKIEGIQARLFQANCMVQVARENRDRAFALQQALNPVQQTAPIKP